MSKKRDTYMAGRAPYYPADDEIDEAIENWQRVTTTTAAKVDIERRRGTVKAKRKRNRKGTGRTVVYEYGCKAPVDGADIVDAQAVRAHRYQHALCEIERERQEAVRQAMAEHVDVAPLVERRDAADAEIERLRREIKAHKQAARSKKGPADLSKRVRDLRAQVKALRAEIKAAKERIREDADLQARIKAINDRANERRKAARGASDVYWGTYLVIEDGIDRARKLGRPPRFRRWDRSAHLAVQIQSTTPLTTKGLFGNDARIQIDPIDEQAWSAPTRSARRPHTLVRFRAASDVKGRPLWVTLPMIMHRPLPSGRVTWIHLIRRPVADKYEWRIQFTIDIDESAPREQTAGDGTVAIDVGWRAREDGIRVAYTVDSHGERREWILPTEIMSALAHTDSLKSIRDRNFNVARDALTAWLKHPPADVPEWLREATKTLSYWRSCAKLAALAIRWRSQRFDGDVEAFDAVEAWRKQDKHLWTWETHERKRTMGRRRALYQKWAVEISRRYACVVVEKFDLRPMAKRKPPENEDDPWKQARLQRTRVAVSVFRNLLKQACAVRGVKWVELPAEYTTMECSACGRIEERNARYHLILACSACGAVWDQDKNAAENLLARASAPTDPGEPLAVDKVA